jgi:hypothetical protein
VLFDRLERQGMLTDFGRETSWKTSVWMTEKEIADYIKIHVGEIGCEGERYMELAQDRVQWQALV